MSEWVLNKLFDLLNLREKRGLTTIFTSNYSFSDLESLQDDAIKSRFE
jgi:DNA replication protein DnaC